MSKVSLKIDKTIEKLLGKGMKDARAYVGWFEDTKYDDGTLVGDVAYWQEYGTSRGIPPRPFMRPAELHNKKEWEQLMLQEVRKCFEQGKPLSYAIERLGLLAQGNIQDEIRSVYDPPLKESTIKARLRRHGKKKITASITKPLIDTGVMLASVQHKVEEV